MSETGIQSGQRSFWPVWLAVAVATVIVASTLALWAHYGTAVFYEMILAGIAACF